MLDYSRNKTEGTHGRRGGGGDARYATPDLSYETEGAGQVGPILDGMEKKVMKHRQSVHRQQSTA